VPDRRYGRSTKIVEGEGTADRLRRTMMIVFAGRVDGLADTDTRRIGIEQMVEIGADNCLINNCILNWHVLGRHVPDRSTGK